MMTEATPHSDSDFFHILVFFNHLTDSSHRKERGCEWLRDNSVVILPILIIPSMYSGYPGHYSNGYT